MDRDVAESMEVEVVPKRQTLPSFYDAKTLESVTINIVTLVMLVAFFKFQLNRDALDFNYRLKQVLTKLVVF